MVVFLGGTRGAAIGHVSPEAAEGGPIALVKDGDLIRIDIPSKRLDLLVPEEELKKRLSVWKRKSIELRGYLRRYSYFVKSASEGATFSEP